MTAAPDAGGLAYSRRYSGFAILLHWTIAILIGVLIALGLTMTDLPRGSPEQAQYFQLHKSIGITVLVLVILRLAWRSNRKPPKLPATMPAWERGAARGSHVFLYVLMFVLPLTGWMLVSSSPLNLPTMLYGVVRLPNLPILSTLTDKKPVSEFFATFHTAAAWVLMGVAGLHIAAALKHLIIDKDGVFASMLPRLTGGREKGLP